MLCCTNFLAESCSHSSVTVSQVLSPVTASPGTAIVARCLAKLSSVPEHVLTDLEHRGVQALLLLLQNHVPACAEFDGPHEEGDLGPEEEALVAAYPQPADVKQLPSWRQPSTDALAPLDVGAACSTILQRLCDSLASLRQTSAVGLAVELVEALMPFALPSAGKHEAAAEQAQAILPGLSKLLQTAIDDEHEHFCRTVPMATASELADTPVLSPVALAGAALIARCALS